MKLSKAQLAHIDNNFYALTPAQARDLSVTGKEPRNGYEIKASIEKLSLYQLGKIEREPTFREEDTFRFRNFQYEIGSRTQAWIKRTPLTWFNGKPIAKGWTFAVMVRNS